MDSDKVERLCSNLSQLLKQAIRYKILKHEEPRTDIAYHPWEAFHFWLTDMLASTKLLQQEQLRLVVEEFSNDFKTFGLTLQTALKDQVVKSVDKIKKLPVCKLGILDRRFICLDGRETFLDIQTGLLVPAIDNWPLETIAYNLTTMFVLYLNKYNSDLGSYNGNG